MSIFKFKSKKKPLSLKMRLLEIKKPRVLGPAALVFKGCLKTPSSSPPRYDNYNDAAQYNDLVFHLAVFHVLQV